MLVLHNVAHQGRGPMDDLRLLEVPEQYKELFRWAVRVACAVQEAVCCSNINVDDGGSGSLKAVSWLVVGLMLGSGPFCILSCFCLLTLPPTRLTGAYLACRLDDPVGGEHMNIMKAGAITAHRWVSASKCLCN